MTGDGNRGDAVADKWRESFASSRRETDLALTRLEVRADMKSFGEEEDSAVIDQRALEAQRKKESEPPTGYGKDAAGLIKAVKGWPQAVFGLGLLLLLGFCAWLKWGR